MGRFHWIWAALVFLVVDAAARICQSPTDNSFSCPSSHTWLQGICVTSSCCGSGTNAPHAVCQDGLGANGAIPDNSGSFEICGPANHAVSCPSGHHVGSVKYPAPNGAAKGNTQCISCRLPQPERVRFLHDSCRWKNALACGTDEILSGYCSECSDRKVKCCVVLKDGCAPEARWIPASIGQCAERNVLTGACGYGCAAKCINSKYPLISLHQFCSGNYLYYNETMQEVCGNFPQCPPRTVAVGISTCGTKSTKVRCAALRSGRIEEEACQTINSNTQAVCPTDYVVVGVCASAVSGDCQGYNVQIRCCNVKLLYNTNPCTREAGWYAVVGNPFLSACRQLGWTPLPNGSVSTEVASTALQTLSLPNLTTIQMNSFAGELFLAASDSSVGSVQVQLNAASQLSPQGIELDDPRSFDFQGPSRLVVALGNGRTVLSALRGASGQRWFTTLVAGNPKLTTNQGIIDGGSAAQRLNPISALIRRPTPAELYIIIQGVIWQIKGDEIYRYAGGGPRTGSEDVEVPAKDFDFREELVSGTATSFFLFVSSRKDNAVYSIHFGRQRVARVLGQFEQKTTDGCATGVATNRTKIGTPAGLAVFQEKWLFVADTFAGCVRRFDISNHLAGCSDIGRLCGAAEASIPFPFSPQALTLGDKHLYVSSLDAPAVYSCLLVEELRRAKTATVSFPLTISESFSESVSPKTSSMAFSDTESETKSASSSISKTTCAGLPPIGVALADNSTLSLTPLEAKALRTGTQNFTLRLESCHTLIMKPTYILPSLQLNADVHPRGEGASLFGIRQISNLSAFLQILPLENTRFSEYKVTLGPNAQYQPTIDETVDFVWPPHAFEIPPATELRVTIVLSPSRQMVFHPMFSTVVSFVAGISLITSCAVASPTTAIRGGRLDHIARISECPLEDIPEPLPFSTHPVGISLGKGNFQYHIGAVVCNLALMLFFIVLPCILAVFLWLVVRSDATQSFPRSLQTIRYPGIVVAPIVLLLQPSIASALKVLWHGQEENSEHGERTASSVMVLLAMALPIGSGLLLLHSRIFGGAPFTSKSHTTLILRLVGPYSWKNLERHEGFVERFGAMFKETRRSRHWFFFIELCFSLSFAVMDAPSLNSAARCQVFQVSTASLYMLYAVLLKILDPFQSPIKRVLLTVSAFCEFAGVAAGTLFVGPVIGIVAMVFVGISALCLFFLAIVHFVQLFVVTHQELSEWWQSLGEASDESFMKSLVDRAPNHRIGANVQDDTKKKKKDEQGESEEDESDDLNPFSNPLLLHVPKLSTNPDDYVRPDRLPILPKKTVLDDRLPYFNYDLEDQTLELERELERREAIRKANERKQLEEAIMDAADLDRRRDEEIMALI